MNTLPTPEGRQEAFARMQKLVLERVYAVPFGSFTKVQAVRSDVNGFVPFRIPRMANVWFKRLSPLDGRTDGRYPGSAAGRVRCRSC